MYDLTDFQRDTLYAIAGQDEPKGLAIKDELDNYYRPTQRGHRGIDAPASWKTSTLLPRHNGRAV